MCCVYEEKAFVITYNPETNKEYNYYVSVNDAFLIARNTRGFSLVMYGKNRYRFKDGSPILSIVQVGY